MIESGPEVATASHRGRVVMVAAVAAALLVGGVAGAVLRSPKTKTVTQTNTVTVTSIVTETSNVLQTPPSCNDALNELGASLAVVANQIDRLRTDAIKNSSGAATENYIAQVTDLNNAEGAITTSLGKATPDVQACRASS